MTNIIDFRNKTYIKKDCAAFRRNKEKYGTLSNMYRTPLVVNDIDFRTSEALYQSCKVPSRSDVQQEIIDQKSPMMAARIGRACEDIREDWNARRVDIMYWCLLVKLLQSQQFNDILESTGDFDIVENSSKDSFWGAKPEGAYLIGANVLGQLLMKIRDEMRRGIPDVLGPLNIPNFFLLGKQIGQIEQIIVNRQERQDGLWEMLR